MFRIVAVDGSIDSPDVDGLPEEMDNVPGKPSASPAAWSTRCGSDDGEFHEYDKLPHSTHSRTSLFSALHANLSSSSSLRDEFHDCINDSNDDEDVENAFVNGGDNNPLLGFFVEFDDDDDFKDERRAASDASIRPPESQVAVSEQTITNGGSSDSVLVPATAMSAHVTLSARSFLSPWSMLVYSAAGLALRTAFLPVTLPLHVTGSLLGLVVGGTDERHALKGRDQNEEEEEVSSNVSTESTTAKDQARSLSNDPSWEKLNGLDESDEGVLRGWTAPLEAAMKVALLPVTGPMYLASTTGSVAVSGCSVALSITASLLQQMLSIGPDTNPLEPIKLDSSHSEDSRTLPHEDEVGPDVSPTAPTENVITAQSTHSTTTDLSGLSGLTETMKGVTIKVLTDLSFLMDSVSPSLRDTLIDPRQEDRMLDRLRLDYHLLENARVLDNVAEPVLPVTPASSYYSAASSISVASGAALQPMASPSATLRPRPCIVSPVSSNALLRVDDLSIYRANPNKEVLVMSRMYYLDLNDELNQEVGDEAISRLIGRGLGLVSNLKEARLYSAMQHHGSPQSIVDWKPERGSSDFVQKLSKLSKAERIAELQSKTLVWSGQFRHQDVLGNKSFPLFASRGIIPWKPLAFISLMWDDAQVQVYNKLCTGRSCVRVYCDEIDAGGSRGTKVVHFTTRVPLTNFTVTMTSLLHISPIQTRNEEDAFVVISRSICSGRSGSHFESHEHVEPGSKSEIIWGVNIVRAVPNQAHLTDLTSVSQVGTTVVPNILARKIGLWGVEDFYRNVRNRNV
jgi:hypothetical protein